MSLKVIGFEDMGWINLAQSRIQWQVLVNLGVA